MVSYGVTDGVERDREECLMVKCSFRTDEAFCNWRIRRIMQRRRRHLECRRQRGGCLVIDGETCQKVLVPTWLKGSRRREMAGFVGVEVLIHGLIFLCVNLLWHLVIRVSRLVVVS